METVGQRSRGMENSKEEISNGLREIRLKRKRYLSVIFGSLIVVAVLMMVGYRIPLVPIVGIVVLFTVGWVMQWKLKKSWCPKCSDFFFVQRFPKGQFPGPSSTSFPAQRKCQRCGLDLYS